MAANGTRELVLIDGNSLAYRAFFALPEDLATSRGEPTNAIFGFASMLVKLVQEHGLQPTLVVWDAGTSGRAELYDDYKAQREETPDLLQQQLPALPEIVEAFGFRNLRVDGYEADDVIATIARRAASAGLDVLVVTGDRDLFQIVDDRIRVLATARGITDTKLYDRDAVVARYGIPPELVPDFVGLKGDTSDNIPGVPGIGEKTAAELLQRFGSLEEVLARVDEVSGTKRREKLRAHAEDARVSKQLATVVDTVPVELDPAALAPPEPNRGRLREAFMRFELREPLRRLEEALGPLGEGVAGDAAQHEAGIAVATEAVPLPELRERAGSVDPVAVAVADDGSDSELAVAAWTGNGPVAVATAESADALLFALDGASVAAHDWKPLLRQASDPQLGPRLVHDTRIAAWLLDSLRRRYELEELAQAAGIAVRVDEAPRTAKPGKDNEEDRGGDEERRARRNAVARAAALTALLAEHQRAELERAGLAQLFADVELPLVPIIAAMERAGIKLDVAELERVSEGLAERIAELEREIWDLAGERFTIGSPQQLARILFEKLGLSRKRRGKTGFSTDARVLQQIRDEHPIVPLIESWRELTKLKSTYIDTLPSYVGPDGRLHTTFNQTGTATGRLSSTNPNLQNIPIKSELGKGIRAAFVAEPGWVLVSADYSQVELRLLAHIAGEERLKEFFRAGVDVHSATAAEILGTDPDKADAATRSKAKMVNYGIVYGLSAFGLADRLNIPREEAQEFIDRYFERFPAIRAFIDRTIDQARREGQVRTLFGRVRRIPELASRQWQTQQLGERLAVNMVIQGTAADVMKVAMVRCDRALREERLRARLVLQIHDELLFEAPEAEAEALAAIVRREMVVALPIEPPLAVEVGVGRNWLEAK